MRFPKPEEWVGLVAEFRASGMTLKEFAAKHDLPWTTFHYWVYKKSKPSTSIPNRVQRFLPVEVVASPALKARGEVIEVALRSGVVLRFVAGTNTRYLAELLAALG